MANEGGQRVRLRIDGREVEADRSEMIIQVAHRMGIEVPHMCYHPGLSIVGICRICQVEVKAPPPPGRPAGPPRMMIACANTVADGMEVSTDNERVHKARSGVEEFWLIHHPLDCPVCDQAGECDLQNIYMNHSRAPKRFRFRKIQKPKRVELGPRIVFDTERCIMCSRCVRFCEEVPGTGELAIADRGTHSVIVTFPGRPLDNPYSGNVADICPVGALTDRDYRFEMREWWLTKTPSVCPGCSRGCNTTVEWNTDRPRSDKSQRIFRIKPRDNLAVNRYWICDRGRYGFRWVDGPDRLLRPEIREGSGLAPVEWKAAFERVAESIQATLDTVGPDAVGFLGSSRLSNEDAFAWKRLLADDLGVGQLASRTATPPEPPDEILWTGDRGPNAAGVSAIGLDAMPFDDVLRRTKDGILKVLVVVDHDLTEHREALGELAHLIFIGCEANPMAALASAVLPAAAYAERDGTFTNVDGRVQRFWRALAPGGSALPDWQIVAGLSEALGRPMEVKSASAVFDALSGAEPAFSGMSYRMLGGGGQPLTQAAAAVVDEAVADDGPRNP